MKFSPGIGVGAMSGSQGGTTASRGRAGQYFRTRSMPTQPNTPSQTAIRTNVATASGRWGGVLTDAQRAGWETFSQNFPITDKLGQPLQLTGQQAYVKLNTRLLNAGQAAIDAAPVDQSVTDVLTITPVATFTGSILTVAFTPTPLAADDLLVIRITPAFSVGKSYFTNMLRDVTITALAEAGPVDCSPDWVAKYGTFPAAGTKLGFEVTCLRTTNGAYDASLRATAIVGA